MERLDAPSGQDDSSTRGLVVRGLVALAVAMGIGRFAFTPLMPLMLRDGTLDPAAGAGWAAANYIGYLVGALTASRFAGDPRVGLRWGLAGVVATTLAGAWACPPWMGALSRAGAGVFSAWVLVSGSSWGLAELARRRRPQLGAWLYTGVGLGIALAGTLAWLGGRQPAAWLWLELGLLAAAGWAVVAPGLRGDRHRTSMASSATVAARLPVNGTKGLAFCYGAFGFGYIVPATFLPAMARQQVDDPLVFGLTWPLFGLAAALSVAGAARWLGAWPRRRVWALAQGVMALGTALPLATQALWALAASAVLVGGTFMVATMAGLQMAREQRPADPTPLLARMTVAFAAGQIAGPLLVRAIGGAHPGGWDALGWSHGAATALLVATATWLWHGQAVSSASVQSQASKVDR